MTLVDSILINKLSRGSRDAFLLLYDKYAHMAYNYALSMLGGDDQAAQDVVQGDSLCGYCAVHSFWRLFLKYVAYCLAGGHPEVEPGHIFSEGFAQGHPFWRSRRNMAESHSLQFGAEGDGPA